MTATIQFADHVTLPSDAVTQTFACIGRKGAGKTYLATMLAEQMLNIQAQIVVLDPVGNWWGLRVAADGKSKGKDIFIAGGERGDVPVLPESGARFAKLVVEKSVSMVLDVSSFRQGERKRFAADFAEESSFPPEKESAIGGPSLRRRSAVICPAEARARRSAHAWRHLKTSSAWAGITESAQP